jgi:CheY-like chemotaxis protein/HPt (histidine-containing phosphotransfer) domain-containing protein
MQEIGFAAYLNKPIRGSQLRDCLALVVSRKQQEPQTQPMPIVTRHSVSEDQKRRMRILLAEDNMINQELAMGLLKKIGYQGDAVANGKEVLSALEKVPYDLILMDVQMPEMDGFEATAVIRRKERENGRHIPIIAMTAHAMKGDRERCLEAGMDDYLTKPIQPKELIEVIKRRADHRGSGEMEVPSVEPTKEEEVFDKSGFLERLGGDESLFNKLLSMFLDDAPVQIQGIQQYLKDEDLPGVQQRADSLKGVAMIIGGKTLQKVASEIEVAARDREAERVRRLVPNLQKEFEKLKHSIDSAVIFAK